MTQWGILVESPNSPGILPDKAALHDRESRSERSKQVHRTGGIAHQRRQRSLILNSLGCLVIFPVPDVIPLCEEQSVAMIISSFSYRVGILLTNCIHPTALAA